ncbi:MAG: hypothetical protein JW822_08800 [Spirochaetales bacterium]|nr:hypothetical protein [Spirochaetales bacterium]
MTRRRYDMSDQKKTRCKGEGFDAWWEERSLLQKIIVGIGFGILGIGLLALFGLVVMLLWNWLMPDIFGLKQIDYWQAFGLLALCTILFKGMHFRDDSRRTDKKRRRQLRSYIREEKTSGGTAPPDTSQA